MTPPPPNGHILILGTCECIILCGKRDFAGGERSMDYPDGSNIIAMVFISERGGRRERVRLSISLPQRGRQSEHQKIIGK